MKHYLVKQLTNTQEQDGSTIAAFDSFDAAIVAYHSTLAAYHNASDVLYAVVQILEENGNSKIKEIVDHRPTPEPEEVTE